jgi:hypothetical protein
MRRNDAEGQREKARAGARAFFLIAFCLALFPSLGCRSCEQVERALRERERELREVKDELVHAEAHNEALEREVCELRKQCGPKPAVKESTQPGKSEPAKPPPKEAKEPIKPSVLEGTTLPSTVQELVLGRGTGGYDTDRLPGDDALQVVVEPHDADGHSLKVPGTLHVAALEILPEGLKKPLSTWVVAADQLRRSWRSGLFSTGYYLVLPWPSWPATDKLRVVVQFELADGRLFEADKDITIRLPPAAYRKPPGPGPAPGDDAEPIPAPRKLKPPTGAIDSQSRKLTVPVQLQPANWEEPRSLDGAVRLLRPE